MAINIVQARQKSDSSRAHSRYAMEKQENNTSEESNVIFSSQLIVCLNMCGDNWALITHLRSPSPMNLDKRPEKIEFIGTVVLRCALCERHHPKYQMRSQ